MIQIDLRYILNAGELNEVLRFYPQNYPKRKIISISCVPTEPGGWFATIAYEVEK